LHTRTVALLVLTAGLLVPAGAQAATKSVIAGPPVKKLPKGTPPDGDANAFFRKTVTIHVGDKVRWTLNGFHTVTFPAKGKKPPAFISPDASGKKLAGFNDAAGAPFWFNGLPRLVLDPQGAFPVGTKTYDGSKLASSGAPLSNGKPKPYTLKFTKAGTYNYYCTIHYGMKGKVKVVKAGKAVPTAKADKKASAGEFAKLVAALTKNGKFAGPAGNVVQAGNDTTEASLFRFFPAKKQVPVGTTVTLQMPPKTSELHTFSFGPADYLKTNADNFLVPDMSTTPPTFVFNPVVAFPSDPPPALPPYTATNHGNGFLSTGGLDRDAATPTIGPTSQITFNTAGTYDYICLIHPFMKGQIIVG
jgi:plastocyanin